MYKYNGPHDYFDESYVSEWERVANDKRPFRAEFFDAFAAEVATLDRPKVLDVGSGPGFLAEQILTRCDVASYHLFDFSPHMLALSRARLARFADRVHFHEGSFLDQGWWRALPGPFDAILSLQAVHEVRDARRIPQLYAELKLLLNDNGMMLIADQVNDEARNEEHFLSAGEHEDALRAAGLEAVRQAYAAGDLALFVAASRKPKRV
jgi:SAM-dependent methyltransferase